MCAVTVNGHNLLASGGRDGTVRLWDPQTGAQTTVLKSHQGGVMAVCTITVNGHNLLASGGDDETVRLWDSATGATAVTIVTHYQALALALLIHAGLGWRGAPDVEKCS